MSRTASDVPVDHPAFTQPADPPPPPSEVQTSAPVSDETRDPVTLEPAEVVKTDPPPTTPEPATDDDEGTPYFRRKDGTFRKATKKEALGEMHSRINTLTGRLRGTEEELQRVRQAPQPPPAATASASPAASLDPNDPEPELEQFVNDPDPYKSLIKATGLWAAREERRGWERNAAEAQARQTYQQSLETFNSRAEEFKARHPDYDEVIRASEVRLSPVLQHVLISDELGPAFAYYLGTHPDEAITLALQTRSLPVVEAEVADVRRVLSARIGAAGVTGSARPSVRSSAPAPLNPVRTGAPALDEPPLTGDVPFSEFVRRGNDADRKRREARSRA